MATYSAEMTYTRGESRRPRPLGGTSDLAGAQELAADHYRQQLGRPCGELSWSTNAVYAAGLLAKDPSREIFPVWYLREGGTGTAYSVHGSEPYTAARVREETS